MKWSFSRYCWGQPAGRPADFADLVDRYNQSFRHQLDLFVFILQTSPPRQQGIRHDKTGYPSPTGRTCTLHHVSAVLAESPRLTLCTHSPPPLAHATAAVRVDPKVVFRIFDFHPRFGPSNPRVFRKLPWVDNPDDQRTTVPLLDLRGLTSFSFRWTTQDLSDLKRPLEGLIGMPR